MPGASGHETGAGWMYRCGEKLPANLTCTACGRQYRKEDDGLQETEAPTNIGQRQT
jgi:hypothetical protein